MEKKTGILYVTATPIGNLEDITLRAIRILKEVDLIACEDTRVTKKLLDHFSIKTHTISYFQHSKLSKIDYLIEQLKSGKNIALVSDAGTPGISDPGQELIRRIKNYESGIKVSSPSSVIPIIPVPGSSAVLSAASVSGIIEKSFYFEGFLPKKKGRQTEFQELARLAVPIIIYESALRVERTLADIKTYLGGNTQVFIAREISKMFEEYWGGPVGEIIAGLPNHKLKGEIVLVVKKLNRKRDLE